MFKITLSKQTALWMVALFGCCVSSTAWSAVVLPIEVMGKPPHVETNTLEVVAGSNMAGARLFVRAHNVSYDYKGLISVNGGAVRRIWNDVPALNIAEPDRSYGGFGGGFSTVTFTMEAPDIQLNTGVNTIEFTYFWKHPDHGTAGYRIIDIDIIDAEGQSLLVANQISFDDPTTWAPPLAGPSAIAAGKHFFENANIEGIGLSCNNCHTHDGHDFKYFNISNKTIIEQCKKSGFSELQGQQLASYIRTINIPVVPQARPWNPPYQPGPGTDSRPVYEWAAGAGLDAVLNNDAEMLPHMFGSATQEEIDAVTDIRTDLNLREIPISVQFPDWIHWIPRIHPMQLWGKEYWETARGEKFPQWNNPHESYLDLKEQFENGLATQSDLIRTVRNDFQRHVLWWIDPGDQLHPWCEQEGVILDAAKARGYTAEEIKLNLSKWRAVKLWGLFTAFDAEDKAYGQADYPHAEKYQWPAELFSVFQIAAHFIGDDRGTSCFAWETPEVGIYYSSIWYQLQMILNPGMRQGGAVSPIDWAYNYAHVNLLGEQTGIHEPLRLVQNLIKGYQQRDRPGSVVEDNSWTMREVSPWRHFGNYDGDQTSYQQLDTYGYGTLRMRILRSMLGQFLLRANEYSVDAWPRTDIRNDGGFSWHKLMVSTYMPIEEPDAVTSFHLFAQSDISDAIDADALYRLIPLLCEIGLEETAVQPLVDWCKKIWTEVNWQARMTSPNQMPVADAGPNQSKIDADGNGIEDVQLDGSGSYDPDGEIVSYEWIYNATVLSVNANPLISVPVGVHNFELIVSDSYGVTDSDTVNVIVNPSDGGDILPPTPNPSQWESVVALSATEIEMTAVTASDPSGVLYYFQWRKGSDAWMNSGWITDSSFIATNLAPESAYTLYVMTSDNEWNMGSFSELEIVNTPADNLDILPPTPNPSQWVSVEALSATEIEMIAVTAEDPNGVEYGFYGLLGGDVAFWSGWVESPSYIATNLNPGATYNLWVQTRDSVGNTGSWSSVEIVTMSNGWVEILHEDFEGGFVDWNDGGTDCLLYTAGTHASEGNNAANLQDDTSTSVMTTDNLALQGKSKINVEFSYKAVGMDDSNEGFWLQISTDGGTGFTTVEEWYTEGQFVNNQFYNESVIISGVILTDQTQLRFRCDASGNRDDIYIDNIRVSVR